MDELINYLRQFETITADQAKLIEYHARPMVLNRGDILLEQNQIPHHVAFVVDGVLSAGKYSLTGDDTIRYFIDEKKFVTDIESFMQRRPVHDCIRAVVASRLLTFTLQAVRCLSTSLQNWDDMTRNLSVKCLLEMVNKRAPVTGGDACSRYMSFERKYPGLSERIPQSVVASYLDLAPATLSRIRRQLRCMSGSQRT